MTTVLQIKNAINKAVNLAEPGDIVLIAGKGHETYQILGNTTIAFDDRAVSREALDVMKTKIKKAEA